MTFIKYPKIKRLGHDENLGILEGTVIVQEKIDGANASIWMEDGEFKCGSRTRILGDESFNGFTEYVKNHEGINKLLKENPNWRLYGEWLVRHTIGYNETAYKQFYLFDILVMPGDFEDIESHEGGKKEVQELQSRDLVRQCHWKETDWVQKIATDCGMNFPHIFAQLKNPSQEDIQEHVGQSKIGPKGEGVVVRNPDFVNKYGDRVLAKVVTQEFIEDNAITFGGNSKHSDTYFEMRMVNQCMTMARIKKIMNKLQPLIDEPLDMKHTPRIIQTAYHDMFEEEMWEFAKKNKGATAFNFQALQKLATKKAARIYHDILHGHESVAYKSQENESN